MSTLLSVQNAHVRYPRTGRLATQLTGGHQRWVNVVRGVSLEIGKGETLAIVGESGSGKTTLAMALMGLVPMYEGDVSFEEQALAQGPRGRLRPDRERVAMMFQDPVGSLSPRMTVRAALAEPFEIHGRDVATDDEVVRLLDLVGLPAEFADRYPHQLSGGQARRIGVARALALEPALLIADEPTAGLDVSIQGDVLNLLSGLQERLGLGILIITHNLNIVRHVADHMAIMYLGRFVEQGSSEDIFWHPRHPYTKALLSANPNPDPDAETERLDLVGEVPSLLQLPSGCEFHTRCAFAEAKCTEVVPPDGSAGPGHEFRCHFPLQDR
ncbi:MAG: ATP-binding cassette domain-containing protein [Gammaproteobacteria bacterium]|nr:ATP-binding cassette domain-containing protein [Gammaproteobacteria bacterium]